MMHSKKNLTSNKLNNSDHEKSSSNKHIYTEGTKGAKELAKAVALNLLGENRNGALNKEKCRKGGS